MTTVAGRRPTVVAHPAVAVSGGSTRDPLVGTTLGGRFRILTLMGHSGTGSRRVYLAEQLPLGRLCTLKVLRAGHAAAEDPDARERFCLEAALTSQLRHPNTVAIFDCGEADDAYYVAMEYLEGQTLRTAIGDAGPFSEERTAHVARQIGWSLGEAHALGLIHGRLTSSSVYLVEQRGDPDYVKVFDFALALALAGAGDPRCSGVRVDARADVHALGALMLEMLTGAEQGGGPVEASAGMHDLVGRSLGWHPRERFRTMDEMLAALDLLAPRR